jgi:hypothetical protein
LIIAVSFFTLLHAIFCFMLKHFKASFCFLFTYFWGWRRSSLIRETQGWNRGLEAGNPD